MESKLATKEICRPPCDTVDPFSAVILIYSVHRAYDIRLTSVRLYGELIHEFDPWFNYRATQYLSDNGWRAFFQWYDYMSWYLFSHYTVS
ncbi:oligosaccharyl transferase STT3 subunit [Trypanosoma brucei equiperdum]|uniref:dolichyl-diphosphooligosaccharide--protein glycotransferase n=1 Tax=Trypanosoma brucei equiperdum TaxID=630700 RepID=A0A3L6L7A7_9TRYP|nr:oligosaccharyl transferase STT3 subunit [Trypanosoma brucei equiperdum]